jgi:hypothetical protein
MAKIITRSNKTINANRFLVGKAHTVFETLVTDHNGKIAIGTNGFYQATFEEKETATRVADALNRVYDEHGVRMPKPKKAKGTAPTEAKKPSLDDFIKANPSCTREQAKAYGFEGTRADLKALKVKLGVR